MIFQLFESTSTDRSNQNMFNDTNTRF